MKKFGIIGNPLSHSYSPDYFNEKFRKEGLENHSYDSYLLEKIVDVEDLLSDDKLLGFNVTIPFKESILPYIDTMDQATGVINAVNCVKLVRHGDITIKVGYNTDWIGFRDSLKPLLKIHHKRALIFGNGGSSKAVRYALDQLGIKYQTVSRSTGDLTYGDLDEDTLEEHGILINTTPLGMESSGSDVLPIPYNAIDSDHICYDLIYNPEKTTFLHRAEERGATIKNGMEMLQIQAEESWKVWMEG